MSGQFENTPFVAQEPMPHDVLLSPAFESCYEQSGDDYVSRPFDAPCFLYAYMPEDCIVELEREVNDGRARSFVPFLHGGQQVAMNHMNHGLNVVSPGRYRLRLHANFSSSALVNLHALRT